MEAAAEEEAAREATVQVEAEAVCIGIRAEFLVCSILHTGLGYTGGASSARILDAADGVIDGAYYGSRIRSGYNRSPIYI